MILHINSKRFLNHHPSYIYYSKIRNSSMPFMISVSNNISILNLMSNFINLTKTSTFNNPLIYPNPFIHKINNCSSKSKRSNGGHYRNKSNQITLYHSLFINYSHRMNNQTSFYL